jgi:quercetin 2,3-dioxygenase
VTCSTVPGPFGVTLARQSAHTSRGNENNGVEQRESRLDGEFYPDGMTKFVLQTVALGPQWPTIDPFLFCAHHDDAYPAGDDDLGPAASLAGRQMGSDFDRIDGWNMYHGSVVPGFPQHPHRGFETVTFVRRGLIDHSDSLGATARFGAGDVQWLTAGKGIVHAEMFPLLESDEPNPLELFQIWLNLPAVDKMADPYFTMLWHDDIPVIDAKDDAGRLTQVTVIAGALDGHQPPSPPPNSWAARPESEVAIWDVQMEPGAQWTLPPTRHADTVRMIYVYDGSGLLIGDEEIGPDTGAAVRSDEPAVLTGGEDGVEVLVLQGRSIGEPVAQYGPFVMNTQAEIEQTFDDYRRTGFGGWPWPTDDPVHPRDRQRFARHADGRIEEVAGPLR